MPINAERLVEAFEILSEGEAPLATPTVAAVLAELAGASEYGLVTLETERRGPSGGIRDMTLRTGSLKPETIQDFIAGRGAWWASLPDELLRRPLPMLLLPGMVLAGNALRIADHPLDPAPGAICCYRKLRPNRVTAFIAAGLAATPSVAEIALFHGLATQYLGAAASVVVAGGEAHSLAMRERECLTWGARGKTTLEIAAILGLSEHTVNHYLTNAVNKLHAANRTHAIVKAVLAGVVEPTDL